MDAHVCLWKANAPGARCDDGAARDLASRLLNTPGFRSYTVINTGEPGLASVTVFETREQLAPVAALLSQRIAPAAARSAGRQRGEVLYRLTAWDAAQQTAPSSRPSRAASALA